MITLNTKIDHAETIYAQLVLPYEKRENSRLRATLASGEEVAIFTERGTTLRHNGFLRILQDTVLKQMLGGLGATMTEENSQFEPESGAYSSGGGQHHHGDGHYHAHAQGPLAPIPARQKIHRPSDTQG